MFLVEQTGVIYSLVQLKLMGVTRDGLTLFLLLVRSLLIYCIALRFFSTLTKTHLYTLENNIRLCPKVILPHIENNHERLDILLLPGVVIFF